MGLSLHNTDKAVSPVVATALLLVVAVAAVVSFQGWFQTFSSSILAENEERGDAVVGQGVVDVKGGTLYFDSGRENLSVNAVRINGRDCNISQNLSEGLEQLDVADCSENVSGRTEVVVETNEGISAKNIYVSQSGSSTGGSGSPSNGGGSAGAFVTYWNTSLSGSSPSDTITLPLQSGGTYNFTVQWGDGTNDTITAWDDSAKSHTYASAGAYEINITGTIDGFAFNANTPVTDDADDGDKLLEIREWGPVKLSDGGEQFSHAENFKITASDTPDLSGITDMSYMFTHAHTFNHPIEDWNMTGVQNVSWMFTFATAFNQSLTGWDTSTITDMKGLFYKAYEFDNNISTWDTSSVTNMGGMFRNLTHFNGDITGWDTSSVTNMAGMFHNATAFNRDISSWDTSNVVDMDSMFWAADSFNQDISTWNTSSVINLADMFAYADSFNQNLSAWDTSNVLSIKSMFSRANAFNGDLSGWNTSNVVNMMGVFYYAPSFNRDLESWETHNVTNMNFLFYEASSFNGKVNTWNTSKVTSMAGTFGGSSFNHPLDNWDTSLVEDMQQMFAFNNNMEANISMWNVENVTNCPNFDYSTSGSWTSSEKPNFTNCSP